MYLSQSEENQLTHDFDLEKGQSHGKYYISSILTS